MNEQQHGIDVELDAEVAQGHYSNLAESMCAEKRMEMQQKDADIDSFFQELKSLTF